VTRTIIPTWYRSGRLCRAFTCTIIRMQRHLLRYVTIAIVLGLLAVLAVFLSTGGPQPVGGASAQLNAAYTAFNANDFDGALNAANVALASDPGDVKALLAKAAMNSKKTPTKRGLSS
jgi:hypothetical protein